MTALVMKDCLCSKEIYTKVFRDKEALLSLTNGSENRVCVCVYTDIK